MAHWHTCFAIFFRGFASLCFLFMMDISFTLVFFTLRRLSFFFPTLSRSPTCITIPDPSRGRGTLCARDCFNDSTGKNERHEEYELHYFSSEHLESLRIVNAPQSVVMRRLLSRAEIGPSRTLRWLSNRMPADRTESQQKGAP